MTKRVSDLHPRIDRRTFLAAAAGTVLLPASLRAQGTQPSPGGTLRVVMPFNPAALDPMTGRNVPDFNTVYTIFDALIDFDPDTLELKPMLAKAWRYTDPTTLVIDLVDGVEFHDGTPFNAEAVKFNLDRYMSHPRSNVKSDLASVQATEVTGRSQVTIKLRQPDASLTNTLTGRVGCIVSPTSIKNAADGNVDRAPVGTGPFKFVEWRDNDVIRVEKNKNYWQAGLPYLDGISLRIISDLNTAARTATAGETDLVLNLAAQQIAIAKRDTRLVAEAGPSTVFFTMAFNYATEPMKDLRIRQALNYAINRDELNTVLMLGLGQPTSSMFPSSFWANDPATAQYYQHDRDRAKSLLGEAGFPNGLEIATWGWPDQASAQRMDIVSSQLAQVGVRLKVTPASPPQANQSFYLDGKGSALLTPQGGWPDPTQTYTRLFGATGQFNASKLELDGFRPLLDATAATLDVEQRKLAFFKLQRFVIEQALHMPQYTSAAMSVRDASVQGFKFGILHSPKFHRVWLKRS